ncbi:hypothetical protein BGZ76_005161, partial [Entomortierella beljakovae]
VCALSHVEKPNIQSAALLELEKEAEDKLHKMISQELQTISNLCTLKTQPGDISQELFTTFLLDDICTLMESTLQNCKDSWIL